MAVHFRALWSGVVPTPQIVWVQKHTPSVTEVITRRGSREVSFSLNGVGETLHEAVEHRAERLVAEGLQRLGWNPAELQRRPKGDARKVILRRVDKLA